MASPSCDSQMTAWGKRVRPAEIAYNKTETAVTRAADAEDVPATRTALEHAGKAAAALEAIPVPRCVDPGGFYLKWLDRVVAAGDNARSQGGTSGLELAEASLKGAPRLRSKLDAELKSAGWTPV